MYMYISCIFNEWFQFQLALLSLSFFMTDLFISLIRVSTTLYLSLLESSIHVSHWSLSIASQSRKKAIQGLLVVLTCQIRFYNMDTKHIFFVKISLAPLTSIYWQIHACTTFLLSYEMDQGRNSEEHHCHVHLAPKEPLCPLFIIFSIINLYLNSFLNF